MHGESAECDEISDLEKECAFTSEIESTCNWDEYVAIDESLDCDGTLTTKEITSALLNEQTEDEDQHSDDDDENSGDEEPKLLTGK
ncbi:GD17521 [Drosophila simulans]|uniref:GD17521 n=1 Tax=Drosophila simulans TaxID=7240 RepID=B4R3Q0_DROSI|nr:GD17521 [Drosophila simulans]